MQKKLTKHGNSLALVIDKPVLRLLDISEDTSLEVSIKGDSLIIKALRGSIQSGIKLSSLAKKASETSSVSSNKEFNKHESVEFEAPASKVDAKLSRIADSIMERYAVVFKRLARV